MPRSTGDRTNPTKADRRIQIGFGAAVLIITIAGWWATYVQARHMGLLMQLGVPMSFDMEGWADFTSFAAFTAMWTIMMVAMMLPSSYPTLLVHRTVYTKRTPAQTGGTLLFALTYFGVWSASGVLCYGAYVLAGFWRSRVPGADVWIVRAAGAALIIAGAYQWSAVKFACLKHCQSPLHFVMEHWRDGRSGAVRMGALHGFYCFGCCWGLMLVLLVMGVMNLGWMAAVGAFILLEKILPSASWLPKAGGAAMVATGILILISPGALRVLSS